MLKGQALLLTKTYDNQTRMSSLDKPYDPKATEPRIYEIWERSGYFNPDKLPGKRNRPYVMMLPPPNVTGSLHMGHALNAVIQDVLIRTKRMQGYRTLWLPGTDHAGIATQNVVEKQLRKEGTTRHELGRERFLERVWQWKEEYGNRILEQLKLLGASCDWSRARFTMDDAYQNAVAEAFVRYYKRGWVYRALRTVSWCVRCQTSLSDLELEYKEEDTTLYYIAYGPFTLATVRPETKFGDTALAVHPGDKRYKKNIGKELEIDSLSVAGGLEEPATTKIRIAVVGDEAVDPKFGTGIIKVTPAHDLTDYDIAQRHKLPMRQVIDHYGRMNEHAGKYNGLPVAAAREKIVHDLKEVGLLKKTEPYHHRVAVCYRCGGVIEPLPSVQWFVQMQTLARAALAEWKQKRVRFVPSRFGKVYADWLSHVRDWTVSRQIWWGHRLPVWFCAQNQTGTNSKFQIPSPKFTVSKTRPKRCSFCKQCVMQQSEDVLDTWFSSALWPFATLGWPKKTRDLKTFYPTSALSTARDIINLWVSRMVFSGIEFLGASPFRDVIIHPTILTREGKRMSKSLGTGVDPVQLTSQFGADATRFGLIWQYMGNQDMHWAEEHVRAGKKFLNKIWNASRFVLLRSGDAPPADLLRKPRLRATALTAADRRMIKAFERIRARTSAHIDQYQHGLALRELYEFFWHHFCDVYMEAVKTQLADAENEKNAQQTTQILLWSLAGSLQLLHPFLPHITEELWGRLPHRNYQPLLITQWQTR